MIPASRDKFLNARQSLMNKVKGKGYATVMLGGILLGSGMTLAGTVSKQTNKQNGRLFTPCHIVMTKK
jgi:hypothetical protein